MKQQLAISILAFCGLLVFGSALAAPIDAKALKTASSLDFTASTTLFDVEGTFHSWKVAGKVDPDSFEESDVRVVIDAASIDTDNDTRDEHLREPDFFHVSTYKHVKFQTKSINKMKGEGRYEVTGDFTIKNTTKRVSIPVTVTRGKTDGQAHLRVKGDLKVDRYDYGLDYEAGMFEPDLDRTVEIRFNLAFAI